MKFKFFFHLFALSMVVFSEANAGPVLTPEISSNVSVLDFGPQVVGQLVDPQIIILTNLGEADLILQDNKFIGEATADFILTMDFCSFQTLAPDETCQIQISMRPTELDQRTAQFAVESNDPDEPLLLIEMIGEGTGSGGCSLRSFGAGAAGSGMWHKMLNFFERLGNSKEA
jgi:hypothetical protein